MTVTHPPSLPILFNNYCHTPTEFTNIVPRITATHPPSPPILGVMVTGYVDSGVESTNGNLYSMGSIFYSVLDAGFKYDLTDEEEI